MDAVSVLALKKILKGPRKVHFGTQNATGDFEAGNLDVDVK